MTEHVRLSLAGADSEWLGISHGMRWRPNPLPEPPTDTDGDPDD